MRYTRMRSSSWRSTSCYYPQWKHSHSALVHYALVEMLHVFSLRVLAGQSTGFSYRVTHTFCPPPSLFLKVTSYGLWSVECRSTQSQPWRWLEEIGQRHAPAGLLGESTPLPQCPVNRRLLSSNITDNSRHISRLLALAVPSVRLWRVWIWSRPTFQASPRKVLVFSMYCSAVAVSSRDQWWGKNWQWRHFWDFVLQDYLPGLKLPLLFM